MNAEPDRVSKAQYARMRGLSDSYVSRLAKQHRLVLDPHGLVLVAPSDVLVRATRHPTRGGDRTGKHTPPAELAVEVAAPSPAGAIATYASTSAATPTLAEAARAEKIERTRKLRLEVAEQAGQLLRRDVVEAETFKRARQAQEALMALKERLAPLLAAESDRHAVDAMLDNEFRHVIALIAGNVASDLVGRAHDA